MNAARRLFLIATVLVSCIGCDRVTKSIAEASLSPTESRSFLGDTVRLELAHNRGAFLGMAASLPEPWRQGVFSLGVGVCLLALLAYLLLGKRTTPTEVLVLSLLLAGGVGNLVDRLLYGGYVIDFLNVGVGPWRTGIFNVADMTITASVLVLVARLSVEWRKRERGH